MKQVKKSNKRKTNKNSKNSYITEIFISQGGMNTHIKGIDDK